MSVVNLDEFVRSTLVQIVKGVVEAQDAVRELSGYVNPAPRVHREAETTDGLPITSIAFDIGLVASQSQGTDAGVVVSVASLLRLNAGGKSANADEAAHRISFSIPIALPLDSTTAENRRAADKKSREALKAPKSGKSWMSN